MIYFLCMENELRKRPIDIICSVLVFLVTPFFFISISALIPCAFRPFYYISVDTLNIPEESGYEREVCIEAYDDVMNFIWEGAEFKTGQLKWTEEEKGHFEDCKPLFFLQLGLAISCGTYLLVYLILRKTKVLRPARFRDVSSIAYGGIATLVFVGIVGLMALVDFERLFVIFHMIAFPGKDNWTFSPTSEEVINILPESFFLVCAVFIIGLTIILSSIAVGVGFGLRTKRFKKLKEQEANNELV